VSQIPQIQSDSNGCCYPTDESQELESVKSSKNEKNLLGVSRIKNCHQKILGEWDSKYHDKLLYDISTEYRQDWKKVSKTM